MIDISHIPRCYANLVAMATRVRHPLLVCLNSVLSSHLVRRFLGMRGISHIPCCYGSLVAMAARVKPQ